MNNRIILWCYIYDYILCTGTRLGQGNKMIQVTTRGSATRQMIRWLKSPDEQGSADFLEMFTACWYQPEREHVWTRAVSWEVRHDPDASQETLHHCFWEPRAPHGHSVNPALVQPRSHCGLLSAIIGREWWRAAPLQTSPVGCPKPRECRNSSYPGHQNWCSCRQRLEGDQVQTYTFLGAMKGCSSIHSSITHACMHASNLRMYNITEWLMTNSICQTFGLFGANGQPSRHLLDPEQMVRASTLPNTRKASKLHPNCKNTTTLQAEMPSQSIRGRHITICRTTRETATTTPYNCRQLDDQCHFFPNFFHF